MALPISVCCRRSAAAPDPVGASASQGLALDEAGELLVLDAKTGAPLLPLLPLLPPGDQVSTRRNTKRVLEYLSRYGIR